MTTRKTQYIQVLGAIGILLPGLFAPLVVNATNGLFGHGFGARQGGIAGSGVAFPQDALAASLNPAGMVYVGRRNDIGVSLFNPERSYEVTGFSPPPPAGFPPFATSGEIDSDSTLFVIPDLGFNWPLDDMSSIGLSIYGNGGMNTDWQAKDTPFGVGTFGAAAVPGALTNAGVNYAELFAALTYSRKFTGNASWGIAGLFNYSRIKMQGLAAFAPFSLDPARLTDQGYDSAVGFGARLGIQGQVGDSVTLGAAYQTKIPNTFDDYAGLFPNGGELDIPPVAQVGLAWKTSARTMLTLDVQYIEYSASDTIGNTSTILPTQCMPSIPFTTSPVAAGPGCLGGQTGFGWDDMTIFKLGYTWETNGGWTWRVGASFGDQPVEEKEVTLNIIAPGVIEQHYTVGFSKKLKGEREFSAALMYAPEECVIGPDLFTPGKSIELCMYQLQATLGYSF